MGSCGELGGKAPTLGTPGMPRILNCAARSMDALGYDGGGTDDERGSLACLFLVRGETREPGSGGVSRGWK